MPLRVLRCLALPACLLALTGACSSDEGDDGAAPTPDGGGGAAADAGGSGGGTGDDGGVAPSLSWPHLGCDPISTRCGYPFPSNVYTVEDDATPTGRRVAILPEILPVSATGGVTLPDPWGRSDGFSPGAAILAYFPGALETGLALSNDIPASLADGSPTVLLDAATGERVPHFAEIDRSTTVVENRALMIRPAVRLRDATRYIVAVRGLQSATGAIAPSPAFVALRDGTPFDDPSIEARRDLYDDIFSRLESAGVERDGLQLAWDFTTASRENNTSWLVHMRDEAFEIVGAGGPDYRIESVETTYEPTQVAFRVNIMMSTPLYLSDPAPGGTMVFGADGLPEPNTNQPFYDVPVELLIPVTAQTEPAKLLAYGHGLLGERTQIEAGNFREFISRYNYAIFGVDMVGLASDDVFYIAGQLGEGRLDRLSTMFDRLHQGFLNALMAMRMMSTSFAQDAEYGQYVDATQRYYHGISQGGIGGGVFMGVATDVTRGVLEVMGQPYNLLLNRSVDFDPFFSILNGSWPNALDQQLGLSLTQMLWDRVEPNGYSLYIPEGVLPNTPPHEVLMRAAIGDHQVSTLGAHVMARAVGAKHVDTGLRDVYGLESVTNLASGSSYFEYDFGLPEDPVCDAPQRLCDDPHGKIRRLPEAMEQMHLFLTTGESRNTCPRGVCSYPEQSGCVGGETNATVCQ